MAVFMVHSKENEAVAADEVEREFRDSTRIDFARRAFRRRVERNFVAMKMHFDQLSLEEAVRLLEIFERNGFRFKGSQNAAA